MYEDKEWYSNIKRIEQLKGPRNWRYHLNFRGFLYYLILVHENGEDRKKLKLINKIVRSLSDRDIDIDEDEFSMLQYFDIFDEVFGADYKVPILIEIAVELQYQLKKLTTKYLKYYIIRRLYAQISFSIELESDYIINKIMKKK